MDKKLFLILILTFSNFWIWKIINEDFIIGICLILLSIIFSFLIFLKNNQKLLLVGVILLITTSLLTISSSFDNSLKIPGPNDLQKTRHSYLSHNLGSLYQNKFVLNYYANIYPKLSILQQNLAYSLDPNLYFFASHPRERAGFGEFEKYPFIYLPFFLTGLVWVIVNNKKLIVGYFMLAVIISSLLDPRYLLGPILFFPLINLIICAGILQLTWMIMSKRMNFYEL